MKYCDINCDMGEGIGNDELIMPFISSANIACGYHAGDAGTMAQTILLAKKYNVHIGAHPSFEDRENFGRTEMHKTKEEIYNIVVDQIRSNQRIAHEYGCKVNHVKPHGALYNMAARVPWIAEVIAFAVRDCDKDLIIFGLSKSHLVSEGKKVGLKTMSEVFADRTFMDDGSLTPRSHPEALITNTQQAIEQAICMIEKGQVKTLSGKYIGIDAETICIHGDGAHAVEFAAALNNAFTENDIKFRR